MSEVETPLSNSTGPERSPRTFLEVTDLWLKVHKMTDVFFAREASRASASNTILSVLIASVVSALLSALSSVLQGGIDSSALPPEYRDMLPALMTESLGCVLCVGFFGSLVGFYLNNVLVYAAARLLGGRGDFTTQAYLQSLYAVPFALVSGLLTLLPLIGPLAVLAAAALMLVYGVRAVKAAHDLTTGKAVVAVFAPVVLALLFACLGLALVGASLIEIISNLPRNM
jgi:hypothetical protein